MYLDKVKLLFLRWLEDINVYFYNLVVEVRCKTVPEVYLSVGVELL